MWQMARGAVDENSPYSYLMLCEYFAETCALATIDGAPVGFVTGFRLPAELSTYFVWQVVVDPRARGLGVATGLLDEVTRRETPVAVRHLEATVTPDNVASTRLFAGFAHRCDVDCVTETLFEAEDFGDTGHEPEIRFRIGPLNP